MVRVIEKLKRNVASLQAQDREACTLIEIIKNYARPSSIIITNLWKTYDKLDQHNFAHLMLNH